MHRAFTWSVLSLSLVLTPARAGCQTDSTASRAAVMMVVDQLFASMRNHDTSGLRAVFEPGARLVGMRPRADGTEVLQVLTVDDFVTFLGRDARGPWIERAFNPVVAIDGTLATVWAEYDFHFGDRKSHCGTDALQLLKSRESWHIVALADTYRTAPCPRP